MPSSIPSLFGELLADAARRLSAEDLALLRREQLAREPRALQWIDPVRFDDLREFLSTLHHRDRKSRYRWRRPQRARLSEIIDRADPRHSFVVAATIDEVFDTFVLDARSLPAGLLGKVVPRCESFFSDIDNAPPGIGQMTPLAVVRSWMQRFWLIGSVASLRVFGTPPSPERVDAPARVSLALQRAREKDELCVLLVGGPRFEDVKVRDSSEGLFVVERSWPARSREQLERWYKAIVDAKPHICVFPEAAFDDEELETWKQIAADHAGSFPVLSVIGLIHRASGNAYTNEAVVLDSVGGELMRHEKLEPFSLPDGRMEHIVPRTSTLYRYLDTPVGRVVVNICRDVRSDLPMLLNRLLGVDWLLVPTFSHKLDFVAEEARVLGARQRTFTAAVNPWASSGQAARAYVPIRGEAKSSFAAVWSEKVADATLFPLTLRVDANTLRMDANDPIFVYDSPK